MKTKVSKNNWECHNITKEIGRFADELGLQCLATGGNCDYVVKYFDNGLMLVLVSAEGLDCPDKLNEPSYASIKLDEQWEKSVEIKFSTAKEAMRFMAKLTEVLPSNIGDLVAQ